MKVPLPGWVAEGIAGRIAPGPDATVLWIHGYTLDSTIWPDLWRRLPGWNHIGIDLPGHGASLPLAGGESLTDLVDRLGDLSRRHRVRHVVGLSFGATVALQLVIQFPAAFASVVLGSPGIGDGPTDPLAQTLKRELRRCFRERGAGPWMTELWMTSPPHIFQGARSHPRLWQRLRSIVDRHPWLELENSELDRWHRHPQRESEMRQIEAATLVVVGDDDMPAFKRTGELLRRCIPRARRFYLPRAGHLALLELPTTACRLMDNAFRAAERPECGAPATRELTQRSACCTKCPTTANL